MAAIRRPTLERQALSTLYQRQKSLFGEARRGVAGLMGNSIVVPLARLRSWPGESVLRRCDNWGDAVEPGYESGAALLPDDRGVSTGR